MKLADKTAGFFLCPNEKDGTKMAQLALLAMDLSILAWDNIYRGASIVFHDSFGLRKCVVKRLEGPSMGGVVNDGRAPRGESTIKIF